MFLRHAILGPSHLRGSPQPRCQGSAKLGERAPPGDLHVDHSLVNPVGQLLDMLGQLLRQLGEVGVLL